MCECRGSYLDDMTSERVDAQGVANIASALQSVFKDKVCVAIWTYCEVTALELRWH